MIVYAKHNLRAEDPPTKSRREYSRHAKKGIVMVTLIVQIRPIPPEQRLITFNVISSIAREDLRESFLAALNYPFAFGSMEPSTKCTHKLSMPKHNNKATTNLMPLAGERLLQTCICNRIETRYWTLTAAINKNSDLTHVCWQSTWYA